MRSVTDEIFLFVGKMVVAALVITLSIKAMSLITPICQKTTQEMVDVPTD